MNWRLDHLVALEILRVADEVVNFSLELLVLRRQLGYGLFQCFVARQFLLGLGQQLLLLGYLGPQALDQLVGIVQLELQYTIQ